MSTGSNVLVTLRLSCCAPSPRRHLQPWPLTRPQDHHPRAYNFCPPPILRTFVYLLSRLECRYLKPTLTFKMPPFCAISTFGGFGARDWRPVQVPGDAPFGDFQHHHEYPVVTVVHKAADVHEWPVTERARPASGSSSRVCLLLMPAPLPKTQAYPGDHHTADTVVLTHAPVGLESQSQFVEEPRATGRSPREAARQGGHHTSARSSLLVSKVEGDHYYNVVGFNPAASFFKFLDVLIEEEINFLSD
ncbi:hypothetical protein LXA43DRAFT_1060921 [Ganoderma leucocontextum]|nr:hypothetical protein LXA43DRAFT_1060921 [Ganoderma leucocontextum]